MYFQHIKDNTVSGISESDIAEWLEKDFVTDSIIKEFNNRLSKADFENYKKYENSVLPSFILAVVRYPNGVADVEEIVTAFENKIGINVTNSTPETVWNKLSGKNYDSLNDLAAAFSLFKNEGITVGSSSSSGGGSKGSGSTAGIVGSTVIKPVFDNNIEGNKLSSEIFDDLQNISWAKEAVYALKNAGAVSGVDSENFAPQENATRAQTAKIIYYVMN